MRNLLTELSFPTIARMAATAIAVAILIITNPIRTVDAFQCGDGPICGGGAGILCHSPIVVDVQGVGFHFTSAHGGVLFDITGNGHPVQIAWTDPHFQNAFLALPGPDGLIHNGKQLFGNFTPQPSSPNPNGFIALAQYDKPENGGNGDGIIDRNDEVFSRLRLWIDENHDGICQPAELHKLPDLGISSLSLKYRESRRLDQYGNEFRFRGRINVSNPAADTPETDPVIYDVFFVSGN